LARAKRQPGVFSVEGARGVSWGIDYIHPRTQRRVRKILKGVTSEAEASKLRAIEIADAARDVINKAYDLKPKARAMTFNAVLDAYLKWSRENKKSWKADEYNAIALKAAFKEKWIPDQARNDGLGPDLGSCLKGTWPFFPVNGASPWEKQSGACRHPPAR
jgi:hypothetical protein